MCSNAHELVFLLIHFPQSFPSILELEVGSNSGEQFGRIEGFGHVIHGSHLEAINQVLHLIASGEEDNGNLARGGVRL